MHKAVCHVSWNWSVTFEMGSLPMYQIKGYVLWFSNILAKVTNNYANIFSINKKVLVSCKFHITLRPSLMCSIKWWDEFWYLIKRFECQTVSEESVEVAGWMSNNRFKGRNNQERHNFHYISNILQLGYWNSQNSE